MPTCRNTAGLTTIKKGSDRWSANTRDRNIDSSRREDSRKGQVDRCEVINVRPHVRPYPADKDFNTVDVQLIDRPRIEGKPLTIEYVKLNSLQRDHGLFQGHPWNPRIGDMIYVYWLAEREALVLGICTSIEQEPVCRSKADDQQQEYVFKLCPWEEPGKNQDGNYVIFPPPKHPTAANGGQRPGTLSGYSTARRGMTALHAIELHPATAWMTSEPDLF